MPKHDAVVLVRCSDRKLPVCPATWKGDGNGWQLSDGSRVPEPVIAWMPLDFATAILDGMEPEIVPAFLKSQKQVFGE